MDIVAINVKTRKRSVFPEAVYNVLEEDGEWQFEQRVLSPDEAERAGQPYFKITEENEYAFDVPQPASGNSNQVLFDEILKLREQNQALQEEIEKAKTARKPGRPAKIEENA